MAMQQINLYQDVFKKTKVLISAQQVLFAGAALLLLLAGVATFDYIKLQQLKSELAQTKAEQIEKYAQLASLQEQVQQRQKNKKLLHQIEVITTEIANKQKVMQVLTSQQFGNTAGFAEHVKGLARQRIEGMWLTGLSISQGGEQLGLKGLAEHAKLLPQYLQRLSSEEAFLGKEFETLKMSRNQNNSSWLDFDLRSTALQKTGLVRSAADSGTAGNVQP